MRCDRGLRVADLALQVEAAPARGTPVDGVVFVAMAVGDARGVAGRTCIIAASCARQNSMTLATPIVLTESAFSSEASN